MADPALRSAGADIFLSKSMSWEDALLVYSSFWQWRMGVQGVLRTAGQHRRKVTIQKRNQLPTLAPGPCRRQLEKHSYPEPKMGDNKYVKQQGTDGQRNAGRPSQRSGHSNHPEER